MAKKRETIYQQVNDIFNLDGTGHAIPAEPAKTNKNIIIRGETPNDILRKNLELQQAQQLERNFYKTTDHTFQKAMQYEAARLPAYLDYEGMEYYPIISQALTLLMEESTTIGENGKMLNIYSSKDRIKSHLEELFYDIINVNTVLPSWVRNTCKYGDNFVHLFAKKKKGIVDIKQLTNYEMEREEKVHNGKPVVIFNHKETAQHFHWMEIAHFRLLGDDKYLPYGSSELNKIRRVFRQLVMAEDAMLTYRIVRAGEKKVFRIDVGNIDEDDIEPYIQRVMSRFKKQQTVYPNDGQIDYRFNILGNDEDYILPVRNGNSSTNIDTLPGANNLNDINDIEYLRDNLFTGLGIPKPMLGFQDSAGDGKNLAQMDIRFTKKINRIQQCIIQELNKIAMIHLSMLGFSRDDLSDFTLSLTNPSTQADLLKTELLQQKAQVYAELTRAENNGIAAMSHTKAKKMIFNMSDKEIIEDLRMQRMERAVNSELENTAAIINQTGIFKSIDDKYGTGELPPVGDPATGEGVPEENIAPAGGGDDVNAPQSPSDLPPVIGQGKGFKDDDPVLIENRLNASSDRMDQFIDNMFETSKKKNKSIEIINEVTSNNSELNLKALKMADEIDELLKETKNESINKDKITMRNYDHTTLLEKFEINDLDFDKINESKNEPEEK